MAIFMNIELITLRAGVAHWKNSSYIKLNSQLQEVDQEQEQEQEEVELVK